MKILLAEDEPRLAEALVHILRRQGYQVDAASDGLEAQEYAERGLYDVIILDRMLPHREGVEILLDCREESVESQRKWLENIDAESRRMTKLVDDLLTLARADTHKQELACEDFSLRQAASEAVAAFEAAASQQGMSLALQMQENIMLQGDRGRLKQLLMILLDNAIRYSGGKGIVVAADCRKGSVALKVRDDGCGIGQEHLGRLFERFYRVAELRGKNPDGSGLGLAIARWIAEGHGGSISVHSTLGKGTEFVVRLPVRNARQKNKKVLAQNLNP